MDKTIIGDHPKDNAGTPREHPAGRFHPEPDRLTGALLTFDYLDAGKYGRICSASSL